MNIYVKIKIVVDLVNMIYLYGVCMVFLISGRVHASQPVTVVQLQLTYNEMRTLVLNSTVEYILEFTRADNDLSSTIPSIVWLRGDGGDSAHPVLITARQRAGAVTWQLPYESGSSTLFELERTLCPDDTADVGDDSSGCVDEQSRSVFVLHVSTACAASINVNVRVTLPLVWMLPFSEPVAVTATQWAPRVVRYAFGAEHSVRLVVSSESELCATLSVQNYTCPIAQTVTDVATVGLRLTMIRSGAVQLSRSDFPRGFFVVMMVWDSVEACRGADSEDEEWLWEDAILNSEAHSVTSLVGSTKDFTISVEAALTREHYALVSVATLLVFLAFYVLFGALVLAQRWPPFAKYVLPKAVLAPQPEASVETATAARRRRRGSNDTYDSCDDSNSDEEYERVPNSAATTIAPTVADSQRSTNGEITDGRQPQEPPVVNETAVDGEQPSTRSNEAQTQGPFGLPVNPRLAELARRSGRTLRARSDRYLYMLYTVAVFYALPVMQFVIAFQIFLNISGSLDYCYYNFLCAHRAGALSDFNHVVSNVGYLLLGALFMLQVRRRRLRRKQEPRHQDYGIPAHYGLLSALGAGMMVVALLSASYHVCPNWLNFQFDTAFMYVLAVLIMVKIYQSRHPDINARAHATFGVLAVLIATVVWGVLGGGSVFWGVFTAVHIFTFLLLSLHIYYFGQFRLEKESLTQAAHEFRKSIKPMYRARLLLLIIGNALNWLLALYGLLQQSSDFAGHLLQVLLGNALMYMTFYLIMKLVHGERLRWYAWALLAGAGATWAPALYFFLSGSSDWSTTPALSRHRNHECKVLQFYDNHDLWHMLSAVALYLSFNVLLTWDDGLSAVKRTEIPVF